MTLMSSLNFGRFCINKSMKKLIRIYDENDLLVEKECRGCDQVLPVEQFNKNKTHKGGYNYHCKKCASKHWHATVNDDKRVQYLLTRIKTKCKKNDIPFNLTIEDLCVPDQCPALNIPLIFGSGKRAPTDNSPSVDRIKPELGYIKGNIIVVSQLANRIKNSATFEQLELVTNFYQRFS